MNTAGKTEFIKQQIRLMEAKQCKVTAVRLSPRDKYQINWNAFNPVVVKFDSEVPQGQFVLETDTPPA